MSKILSYIRVHCVRNVLTTYKPSFGTSGKYTDRPTISYAPLVGEKFTRSLLTPIPPTAVLSLVQAGWPVDATMRLAVQAINGIQNRSGRALMAHPGDPKFFELVAALRRLQENAALGMRLVHREGEQQAPVLFFDHRQVTPEVSASVRAVKTLLGIDDNAKEIALVYGMIPRTNREIALLTRSMMQISIEFASGVDIPQVHLTEGRATVVPLPSEKQALAAGPPIRIQSTPEQPQDAFLAVPYRDHWFWIDDLDMASKRTFSFAMFLYSLAQTGRGQREPVLTVPTGP